MARRGISGAVADRVRAAAQERCGYCLSPQHLIMARLEIEHLHPLAQGGSDAENNLWLACPICNGLKSDKITAPDPVTGAVMPLFNPRTQEWGDHFSWRDGGRSIVGISPVGRATVALLRLDDHPIRLAVWASWISAGWHPPRH